MAKKKKKKKCTKNSQAKKNKCSQKSQDRNRSIVRIQRTGGNRSVVTGHIWGRYQEDTSLELYGKNLVDAWGLVDSVSLLSLKNISCSIFFWFRSSSRA